MYIERLDTIISTTKSKRTLPCLVDDYYNNVPYKVYQVPGNRQDNAPLRQISKLIFHQFVDKRASGDSER